MRRRDNIQAEFEVKSDTLASRKSDLDALQDEVDELAERMEKSNSALQLDWSRWRNTMRADLKAAFVSSAEKNVEYYEKCLAVWESFLVSQRGESISQRD
ncbi:Sorting nexin-7 [Oryzias melastigma]|nr:Sorting nexin-7 [Oryzias melastigma]